METQFGLLCHFPHLLPYYAEPRPIRRLSYTDVYVSVVGFDIIETKNRKICLGVAILLWIARLNIR